MSYRIKSDKELVVLLNSNDEAAFRELYIRYKDRLWNYIFAFLKAVDESDDLIQEIFIQLWELRHSINPELSFSAFIYTIAKNKVLNYFRGKDMDLQYKKALIMSRPIEMNSIDADIIYLESLLSGEILPQLKLRRPITLRNISSEVSLIKYIFNIASFEEDLTNRI